MALKDFKIRNGIIAGADSSIAGTLTATTFSGSGLSLTSIPESAITDGTILARLGANETISGTWTFSNQITGSISGNSSTTTALATGRTISLSGDVTGTSASWTGSANLSFAATIANDAVTYAKMQNVSATSRILGRISASAGDIEELTSADIYTILGITSTSTKLNYLTSATGTTGTASTNLVFSTSPILITPTITTSLVTDSTSFSLINTTATTINFAGAATTLNIGSTTGTVTIKNAAVTLPGGLVEFTNSTASLITFPVGGSALPTYLTRSVGTKIVFWKALSDIEFDNAIGVATNTYWFSIASVNSFKWISSDGVGSTLIERMVLSSTALTIGVNEISTSKTSFSIANTTATTINFAGAATIVNMLAAAGTLNINSTVESTSTTTGALVIDGGVGIAKKVYLASDLNVAGNLLCTAPITSSSSDTQVITKGYLETLTPKQSCRVATSIPLTYFTGATQSLTCSNPTINFLTVAGGSPVGFDNITITGHSFYTGQCVYLIPSIQNVNNLSLIHI